MKHISLPNGMQPFDGAFVDEMEKSRRMAEIKAHIKQSGAEGIPDPATDEVLFKMLVEDIYARVRAITDSGGEK